MLEMLSTHFLTCCYLLQQFLEYFSQHLNISGVNDILVLTFRSSIDVGLWIKTFSFTEAVSQEKITR